MAPESLLKGSEDHKSEKAEFKINNDGMWFDCLT